MQKLLARGYGHIFLSSEGLSLDVLTCMTYENIMFVRSEVIQAPNGIDLMLRLWFGLRILQGRNGANVSNSPFKVDIFLPSHMSAEQLPSIINFIAHESNCKQYGTAVIQQYSHNMQPAQRI